MELKDASMQEIHAEIARRRMLAHDANIKEMVNEICSAYNNGKISGIKTETRNGGTSAEVMTYFVHLK